ncbi:MAG: hypothetical protein OEX13_04950 [Gammaproteobacteria bacterium]|nr:hypothetical protein [Gammaproteobacteria bacterium]
MTPAEFIREMLWPVRDTGALLALLGFFVLAKLALAAGLLGIWLFVVTIPALFRYLLYLLEARAERREVPTPGIELFNWVENFWSLFPLVVFGLVAWGDLLLADRFSPATAIWVGVAVLFVTPAVIGVLAITHSPLESLNPLAWRNFVRLAGWTYLLAPAGTLLALLLAAWLSRAALPAAIGELAWLYAMFLCFSLTGRVAAAGDIGGLLRAERHEAVAVVNDRKVALDHAYGMISRGNLDGGLAHIAEFLGSSQEPDADRRWLFEQMLGWDRYDAALYYAQDYLGYLLDAAREIEAVKLISRCLLLAPDFRPAARDRGRVALLLERMRRDDILRQLGPTDRAV